MQQDNKQKQKGGDQKKGDQKKVDLKKGEDLGITIKRDENFSEWFIQILTKGELIDYTEISGCYVFRPNSYALWEAIQAFFDAKIKKDGVKNAYFPCFVSKKALEAEKENFEGFCPEVAWVTKSGESELAEPIALRPTSETIMYPMFSKWVRSHRDLPLRLNQWCNVVRWEMKRCVPFLRSREFLWQEGHSVFATQAEAEKEVLTILDFYRSVYEDLLAVPVTKGRKTDAEKFAGADYTTTIEAYVSANGRAVQAATSHHLGQAFAKVFKIEFENDEKKRVCGWQNSWGLSTRTIGVMIMVHGDDKGLRLPPRVAPIQIVIVPIPKKGIEDKLNAKCDEIAGDLHKIGLRVEVDKRDNKPGWKYNDSETRGIPIRLEIGEKDLNNNSAFVYRRDTQKKEAIPFAELCTKIPHLLDDIHNHLYAEAKKIKTERTKQATSFSQFVTFLNEKCIVLVPFCCKGPCEDHVKDRSKKESVAQKSDEDIGLTGSAKSLCIPFEQPDLPAGTKCFGECGADAVKWCLFGRSY
jgi:prolyl-tRNA synthetase